jgi:hypothetical protein
VGHAHVHTPHELAEPPEAPGRPDRTERLLELFAILLMSITTVATAWSGYQAARWSGEQSQHYAKASATRTLAQRAAIEAGQLRIDDLLDFNGWLDAHDAGDTRLARIYERRFRAEFRPAFRAWLAERPFRNTGVPVPGPLYEPSYHPRALRLAHVLDERADAAYQAGTEAKGDDDKYILSTVFFAAVLFFAGISLRLLWRPLRITVLAIAGVLLLGGVAFVLSLPTA